MKLADRDLAVQSGESENELRTWYCHLFFLERRKCVICTHAPTLFTLIIPRVVRADLLRFSEVFRAHAQTEVSAAGLSPGQMRFLLNVGPDFYSKTGNRAIIGSMNEFIKISKFLVARAGGVDYADFTEINAYLNETLMSYIGMSNGLDRLKELFASGPIH